MPTTHPSRKQNLDVAEAPSVVLNIGIETAEHGLCCTTCRGRLE